MASTTLQDMFAERCLGPVIKNADWNTEGLQKADFDKIGEYLTGDENTIWASPTHDVLLAVRPHNPAATIRHCGVASLPFPAAASDDLPGFAGEEFGAVIARFGMEPIKKCWGLEARGEKKWLALGRVAGTGKEFSATLTRSAHTIEMHAGFPIYSFPTGDIRQDCATMTSGDG
ncbi:MAG: hypothetical protein ACSHWS_08360 [Sulfitobacter sp.]